MINQTQIEQLLEQARSASRDLNYEEAKKIVEKILTIIPENAEAHYILGCVPHTSKPLYHIRQAIRIDPSHVGARMVLVRSYCNAVDDNLREQAMAECMKVIELSPDHAEAYKLRGKMHAHKGNLSLSKSDFSKAISLTSDDASLYIARGGISLREEKYNEILTDINAAFALDSENPFILQLIKSTFEKKPDFIDLDSIEIIAEKYKKHIDFNNTSIKYSHMRVMPLASMYKILAIICTKHNKHQYFIDKYKTSIDSVEAINGTDAEMRYLLGMIYSKLGQHKKALSEFDTALREQPTFPKAREEHSKATIAIIEEKEKDVYEKIDKFLLGPESIFRLHDKFLKREEECVAHYRGITQWIAFSFLLTFLTIALGIAVITWWINRFDGFSLDERNAFFLLPYIAVLLLFIAVPVWWTRILLRSRDRWQILQEDCFRKAAIMQYIQATGSDKEFRNHIILETIKHMANRSGADLLVALHSDDPGMLYPTTDIMEKMIKKKPSNG